MQYKQCPECGAHLDHGERCDCKDDEKKGVGAKYLSALLLIVLVIASADGIMNALGPIWFTAIHAPLLGLTWWLTKKRRLLRHRQSKRNSQYEQVQFNV